MGKVISFLSILFIWPTVLVVFIFLVLISFTRVGKSNEINLFIASSSHNVYDETSEKPSKVLSSINAQDSRAALIDNFLASHHSPMVGLGNNFIAAADKYGIDWRLLPAIAFQESNLGKKAPTGTYNPFGWAIYPGSKVGFNSWADAINLVSASFKKNYSDQGLTEPETIVAKYTAKESSPTWVFAVKAAMEEISANVY
jgi:hypothetical protein